MQLARFFHSLKFRIIALAVLASVAAALGTAMVVVHATQAELQKLLLQSDREEAEQYAGLLASKLDTLKSTLVAVSRHVSPELWHAQDAMERFLLGNPALQALYDVVAVASADGAVLARIERGKAARRIINVADREYFQRAMQGDQALVSTVAVGKVNAEPLVIVAMPVLGADGKALGLVFGTLRLRSSNLFANAITARLDSVRDLVITREGTLLSHFDPKRLLGRAQDEPGLAAVFARWQASGSPIDTTGSTELSQNHLVSMAGIAGSDWAFVRVTQRDAALAPLAAVSGTAWAAALVAGALAALVAGAVAWATTRPMAQLRDRALGMLRGGGAAAQAWPQGVGEVGEMSLAFQQLLAQGDQQRADAQALLLQMQAVLDNADVGLALTRDGQFEMVSRQFCSIFQCDPAQARGHATRMIYASDEAYAALAARATPAFMQHGMFDGELELMRRDGSTFWAHMRGRAVAPGDRTQGTIWVISDITQARQQHERLSWAAHHDKLTALVNRARFEVMLEEATALASEAPFCALFIDLDRFKQVNDSGGHAAGDALLRDIAQQLASMLRKADTVARMGGDEFAVLLPQCPIPQALAIADKLRAAVDAYRLSWDGQSHSVGASIGLVAVNGSHANAAAVLRAADAACYEAKRLGRNQVAVAA